MITDGAALVADGTDTFGYVSMFPQMPNKRFVFAVADGLYDPNGRMASVRLSLSGRREVAQNPQGPQLLNSVVRHWITPSAHPTKLVMRVVPGKKSREASVWGVVDTALERPPAWLATLIEREFLAAYIGREVAVGGIQMQRSFSGVRYRGILGSVELTAQQISFVLENPRRYGRGNSVYETGAATLFKYSLVGAQLAPGRHLLAIDVLDCDKGVVTGFKTRIQFIL